MDCMRQQFDEDCLLGGRFQTISPLNHGSFGMVFLAQDTKSRLPVAIKCLTKKSSADDDSMSLLGMSVDERSEELAVHSTIGYHKNIVNLIHSFETDNHVYLVLDFCPNGDLYEAIRAGKGPLETEHVRDFMLQLVSAVEFMHSKGIYHRDIKPENIFLTSSGSMKLGDFGLATTEIWSTEYGVGSDRYMAPEQYDGAANNGYSPAAADIWAIGICLLNVLFSRNPFAFPSHQDPLFSDYIRDRQSLFDVFPNMSQDTFNVLMQCLALDPTKRSLSGVRDALQTVLSFTTDDESLDEFCSGNDVVQATLNREPLRTPSISSPPIDNTGSFPWAKALQETPQKQPRQLSVIPDTDEMFPEPTKRWNPVDAEAASLASAMDSGVGGMSYKSSNMSNAGFSMPVSSSLPISTSRAMASIYGKDGENFSKSWSDLWEEEEEELENQRSSFESAVDIERIPTAKPSDPVITRASTPALDIKPASRGSSTPRISLAELRDANSRSNSPESFRHRVASSIRQIAASAPQRHTASPKRTGSSIMDKWSALGNLRRSNNDPSVSPRRANESSSKHYGAPSKTSRSRERAGSWRKNSTPHPFSNDAWNVSKDWRSPQQHYTTSPAPVMTKGKSPSSYSSSMHQAANTPRRGNDASVDDIGDLEWVGGWHDFHL